MIPWGYSLFLLFIQFASYFALSGADLTTGEQNIVSACFPFGAQFFGAKPPNATRDDWWCPISMQYGFMGFSYPMENPNCNNASISLSKINADFARMKNEFGASMVRIYAPECRDATIWRNLLLAGIQNNMAVIPQVWWGFANQNLWKQTRASILAVIEDPQVGPLAPYVFHSVEFGSEPIGDGVDGKNFLGDLVAMKNALLPYGIPITISEDWERPGTLSDASFSTLGPVGKQIGAVIDQLHVHPMPYYRAEYFPTSANIWPYFQEYISFLETNLPNKQILISQTMWGSELGDHPRGYGNPGVNMGNFTQYWNTIRAQCEYFKLHQVGWFAHTWDDSVELGLGILDINEKPKMPFSDIRC